MKNQILKSYAKIKLFLNVAKKSKNESLHNIQSLVFLINIIDKNGETSLHDMESLQKYISNLIADRKIEKVRNVQDTP